LTRGDRRRNDRIAGVRAVVTPDRAVLAIDLGEDKQVAALMDHDGRVLGRRTVKAKAWALEPLLEWAGQQAVRWGFASVVVSCEPTGHRWRAVMGSADAAGLGFVCVQSFRVKLAREADDYTRDKTDHKDAVLIGKLTARLECYLPERAEPDWARLRHLGRRRDRIVTDIVVGRNQIRDLLGCVWPAALGCAAGPFDAMTWKAALAVVLERCDGDPAGGRDAGRAVFEAAVRRELPRWGGKRVCGRIVEAFYDALADRRGVAAQRRGGLERVALLMGDWQMNLARLADTEQRMLECLDTLGLTELVCSIPGLSAVGAAAILAETGDPSRFATARGMVKHAGLNPCENTSATFRGRTRISRRGRPALRTAAWRAAWVARANNPVLAARHHHLTTRETNRLTPGQARVACAATLLRGDAVAVAARHPHQRAALEPRHRRRRPACHPRTPHHHRGLTDHDPTPTTE
jgi:transposase